MQNIILNKKNISHTQAGKFEETRFEKIHNVIFDNSNEASVIVAEEIAKLIRKKQEQQQKSTLILVKNQTENIFLVTNKSHSLVTYLLKTFFIIK